MTEYISVDPVAGVAVSFDPEWTGRIDRDVGALEAFYLAHYDEVVRFFTRRVSDPHDVADLVADTFVGAISAASTYEPRRGRPVAWLFGIAHNVLRRSYRRQRTDEVAARRVAGRRLLDEEDIARLEEQIDAKRRLPHPEALLDRLTTGQRELFELVELDGMTPQEAARVAGVSAGVARIRLFRARTALREAFHLASAAQPAVERPNKSGIAQEDA